MSLLWCCVVAAFLATINAAIDVEKTVKQVQSILTSNDLLPRLSRDEILQLLNDIREEDAKTTTPKARLTSRELKTTTPYRIEDENEINPVTQSPEKFKEKKVQFSSMSGAKIESTTKSSAQTLTVVFPYTPRDGSSLQELYTRPPRIEVVQENLTPKPLRKQKSANSLKEKLTNNAKVATEPKSDFPAELQAFLDAHGLKGNPEKDHFLLPLDGFKPLPPAKIIDGNVDLPENILLTYDLISPADLKAATASKNSESSFLYEPLQPEYPFELDTAASNSKETVLPLDLPIRKPKSIPQPNYEPIDYDSVKVIPLNMGLDPIEQEKAVLQSDPAKRQTNETETTDAKNIELTTTVTSDSKSDASDSASVGSDAGASISDLEDSFGGPAPETPGDSEIPPPKKNGFYWMVDWNSFLEVGDGDTKVNIRFEPKLGDPQMFLPITVP
ncbi:unnamed protein product [Pieris macdunnoughi]|uniref:Uncharacterized protein n=1 Tax=Pieris macdunnoughi TaxID=345717 RepID=A0A821R2Y6_9NEOP|nr:unnamed protein product [Pieris macdunnoughi]